MAGCIGIQKTVTGQSGEKPSLVSPEYKNIIFWFQVGYIPCV
jgi:hypothetical protein